MQCQVDEAPQIKTAKAHPARVKSGVSFFVPATFAALILTLVALESFVFPLLEDKRVFWGASWQEDEKKLFKLSCLRNWASQSEPLFRNSLIAPLKEKTGPRLLVMGDSFVWGDGYRSVNDIWWRQLQLELSRRGYKNIEVLGAGYPGYGTGSETKAAEKLVRELNPDMVIWGYTENDPDEGLVPQKHVQGSKKLPGSLRRFLPNVSCFVERQMLERWTGLGFTDATETAPKAWEAKLLEGENYKSFCQTVKKMGALLKEEKIPGFAITLPKRADEKYYSQYFEPVSPLFAAAGVPFVDTSHDLKSWYDGAVGEVLADNPVSCIKPTAFLQISPANSHPSAGLTKFYASACADYLEANYRAVLGTKTKATASADAAKIIDCLPVFTSYSETAGSIAFKFPDPSLLLSMPGRRPYVQFNFKEPVLLSRISLSGSPSLSKAHLAVSYINDKLGFDTSRTLDAERDAQGLCQVKTERPVLVNSLRVAADFKDNREAGRELKLSF